MKHLILSILTSITLLNSNAQITYHLPHENAIWGQFLGSYFDNPFGADYYIGGTNYYAPLGDSIIDNKTYIKIYQTDSFGNSYGYEPRLIREDGDRVYYLLPPDNIDTLLYDFSLQPGDTISPYADWGITFDAVVDSISSIQILNENRKCIYFNVPSGRSIFNMVNYGPNDPAPVVWIEGIGSNDGLFTPGNGSNVIDGITFLSCFKENDTLKYGDDCGLTYTSNENNIDLLESVSVFPNPASTTITLSLPSNQSTILSIFNLLGEKMKEEKVTGKQITLDVSSLPQGLYLVRTENRVVGQFVKE